MSTFETPFVKIFTSKGELVDRVSRFEYAYSQDGGDKCEFTIETDDVTIADRAEFQEGVVIKVMWGYLGGKQSKSRTVKVDELKPEYAADGVTMNVLCTALMDRTKLNSSRAIHSGDAEAIAQQIAKDHGLVFRGIGKTYDGHDFYQFDNYESMPTPSYQKPDGNFTSARESTSVPAQIIFKIYDALPQANKSDFRLLREIVKQQPGGPYEVTGRDDELIVRKRPLGQKSTRTYEYNKGRGDVISFSPETKHKLTRSEADNIRSTVYNEDSQEHTDMFLGRLNKIDTKLADLNAPTADPIVGQDASAMAEYKKDVQQYRDNIEWSMNRGGLKQLQPLKNAENSTFSADMLNNSKLLQNLISTKKLEKVNLDWSKELSVLRFNTSAPTIALNSGNFTAAVDKTAVVVNAAAILAIRSNNSTDNNVEDAANTASNGQGNADMNMNPGSLHTIGDPEQISGVVITVDGVGKRNGGNYYVKKLKHIIKGNSYYECEFEISRNATNASEADDNNKVPVQATPTQTTNKTPGPTDTTVRTTSKLTPNPGGIPIFVNTDVNLIKPY